MSYSSGSFRDSTFKNNWILWKKNASSHSAGKGSMNFTSDLLTHFELYEGLIFIFIFLLPLTLWLTIALLRGRGTKAKSSLTH